MPTKLDWQTEDETVWEEEPAVAATAAPRSRWPLLVVAVVVLLLGGFAWTFYRQANQRVAAAMQAAETDVLSSHRLVRQAIARGDLELFRVLLSARDRAWARAQEDLLAAGYLFAPTPLGFQTRAAELDEPAVTLSPDLSAAEVLFAQPYAAEGSETTVTLQHTAVYRRGAQRWLLSPPDSAFWGEQMYQTGNRLTLVYPQRDETLARRLFTDLEARLVEMCRALADLNCPPDLHVTVRLEYETPTVLALPAEPIRPLVFGSNLRLGLPAATLVGLPLDEVGYQALFRGYAQYIVTAVITQLVGYDCCRHGLVYQALLDKQLSQLRLRPWPEPPDQAVVGLGTDLAGYWETADVTYPMAEARNRLYALVDYVLAADAANSAAGMQRRLGQSNTYHTWLNHFLDGAHLAGLLAIERLPLVNLQSPAAPVSPPVALPEQSIQLVCQSDSERITTLYRYDLATASLAQEYVRAYPNDGFVNITPLAHNQGYVLHEQVDGEVVSSWLALVQDSEEIVVAQNSVNNVSALSGMLFTGATSPSGRHLVLSTYGIDRTPELRLLDLAQCAPGDCPLQPLQGMPLWSPDGLKTLTLADSPAGDNLYRQWQTLIHRGDGRGQALAMVGPGGTPFWLDGQRYGYVRLNNQNETEIVTAANDGAARVWLQSSDLLPAIPSGERPEDLYVWQVMPSPAANGQLVLMATPTPADNVGPYYFFLVEGNRTGSRVDEITLLTQADFPSFPEFSPDGRWLLFTSRGTIVYVVDTTTGRTVIINQNGDQGTFSGWSADGQWLLQKHDDHLSLTAPAHDYRLIAQRDFAGCYNVFWVDEE